MPGDPGDELAMNPLPAAPGCDCHICRPDDDYSPQERRTIDVILQHGWQVTAVSDAVPCTCEDHQHDHGERDESMPPTPAFAYTIGLGHRCGHPELLISGLDRGLMGRALNNVAERVLNGRRLAPGEVLEGVLGGVPVVVERVSAEALAETVIWSGWFHRREPEALMIVWPTTSGVFAWQPGAPAILDESQPRSWRAPIRHQGGVAAVPDWTFPVPADRLAFTCTHVLDDGDAILWVARESDPTRGEDWSLHCGAGHHDLDTSRAVHLAHLVRSAPSVVELAGLGLDEQAWRDDVDAPWQRAPLS